MWTLQLGVACPQLAFMVGDTLLLDKLNKCTSWICLIIIIYSSTVSYTTNPSTLKSDENKNAYFHMHLYI